MNDLLREDLLYGRLFNDTFGEVPLPKLLSDLNQLKRFCLELLSDDVFNKLCSRDNVKYWHFLSSRIHIIGSALVKLQKLLKLEGVDKNVRTVILDSFRSEYFIQRIKGYFDFVDDVKNPKMCADKSVELLIEINEELDRWIKAI